MKSASSNFSSHSKLRSIAQFFASRTACALSWRGVAPWAHAVAISKLSCVQHFFAQFLPDASIGVSLHQKMNLDFISDERIKKQILFALEMDKLKQILRKTSILGKSRKENSAEHSWHLALIAILLAEYANESIDLLKTLKMILVHDIAEIEAGDTLVYHRSSSTSKKEDQAAQKIFSNLPSDQAKEFYMLWKEFEEGDSIEARFARAMDRMAPVLLNYANQGDTWREYSISHQQALKINDRIVEGSSQIWEIVKKLFSSAIEKGFLGKGN